MCLHGANPGLVGLLTIEEGSPNACARSSTPFSVAGHDNSCEWSVSKQWIQILLQIFVNLVSFFFCCVWLLAVI